MASIYKRKQNLKNKRAPWYIGYTSETGKRCTVKGFSEKGETERLAAKLEHEVMLQSAASSIPSRSDSLKEERLLSLNTWQHSRKALQRTRQST